MLCRFGCRAERAFVFARLWVAGTDVGAALAGVQKAQEAADEAKQKLKDAKEQLASALED